MSIVFDAAHIRRADGTNIMVLPATEALFVNKGDTLYVALPGGELRSTQQKCRVLILDDGTLQILGIRPAVE